MPPPPVTPTTKIPVQYLETAHERQQAVEPAGTAPLQEASDSFTPRILPHPPIRAKAPLPPQLSTEERRTRFRQIWDDLQSKKQLGEDCQIKIGGVIFKGDDAFLLLSCQALTAYFQSVDQLKKLEFDMSNPVYSEDKHARFERQIQEIEKNLKALEEILQLEGIKKYWHQKNQKELTQLFQQASGVFWTNSTTQKSRASSFLFDVSPEMIENPNDLKPKAALLYSKLYARLTPYQWGEQTNFSIGPVFVQDKSLPFNIGDRLKPGFISLTDKAGRKRFQEYEAVLEDALTKTKPRYVQVEINGKMHDAKQALAFLAERSVLSYLQMVSRYQDLLKYLKRQAEQDDIERALQTARLHLRLTPGIIECRKELGTLRNELMGLTPLVFNPATKEKWKSADLRGQDPEEIRKQLMPLLTQKMPCSQGEKRSIKSSLQMTSELLQSGDLVLNKGLQDQLDESWKFLSETCDSQGLNELFEQKPLRYLDWALSKVDMASTLNADETAWLKGAMFTAIELVKAENAYREKLCEFAFFVSDPDLTSKISDEEDQVFLSSISQKLKSALENSQSLNRAMRAALGFKLSETDSHDVNFSDEIRAKLEGLSSSNRIAILLKLCNLHTTSLFQATINDSELILNQPTIDQWESFISRNQKPIEKYWSVRRKQLEGENRHLADMSYHNLLYMPFQQRIGRYPLLWQTLKKNVPPIFRDALEITYLRIKTKTDEVACMGNT